jgi:hypothetical protein
MSFTNHVLRPPNPRDARKQMPIFVHRDPHPTRPRPRGGRGNVKARGIPRDLWKRLETFYNMSDNTHTSHAHQDDLKERAITYTDNIGEQNHEQHQHVAGSALLIDKNGAVRKLPVPSSNPNDPLNWKKWEKAAVIFCCCWFCKFEKSTV